MHPLAAAHEKTHAELQFQAQLLGQIQLAVQVTWLL